MLARMYRYLFPIACSFGAAALAAALKTTKRTAVILMGVGCVLYALYTFVGYKCRWKHLYCAYQDACHQIMTPHDIRWGTVKKSEMYVFPIIFGVLGIAMILCGIFAV